MQVSKGAEECKVVVSKQQVLKQQNIVPQLLMTNETQAPTDPVDVFLNENETEQSSEMNNQQTNKMLANPTLDNQQIEETPIRRTRTRVIRRPQRLIEVYSAYDAMHKDDYKMQDDMTNPIAFLAQTSDPDTMYYHQAMKQPDRNEFVKAVIKEINDHVERKHWELIPIEEVPENTPILDSVWAMKRKRDLVSKKVLKHKARLNVHGGQQQHGVNFFETYSPVVAWFSIRILLTLALMNRWYTRQIDFIMAYPQAPVECDIYMKLPKGIETRYGNGRTHVLKLLKNLYGQKQAGRVWNEHLVSGLREIGFEQSKVDECVFYRGQTIFVVYVDDGIFARPNDDKSIKQSTISARPISTLRIKEILLTTLEFGFHMRKMERSSYGSLILLIPL
jgi:hypothetical protein